MQAAIELRPGDGGGVIKNAAPGARGAVSFAATLEGANAPFRRALATENAAQFWPSAVGQFPNPAINSAGEGGNLVHGQEAQGATLAQRSIANTAQNPGGVATLPLFNGASMQVRNAMDAPLIEPSSVAVRVGTDANGAERSKRTAKLVVKEHAQPAAAKLANTSVQLAISTQMPQLAQPPRQLTQHEDKQPVIPLASFGGPGQSAEPTADHAATSTLQPAIQLNARGTAEQNNARSVGAGMGTVLSGGDVGWQSLTRHPAEGSNSALNATVEQAGLAAGAAQSVAKGLEANGAEFTSADSAKSAIATSSTELPARLGAGAPIFAGGFNASTAKVAEQPPGSLPPFQATVAHAAQTGQERPVLASGAGAESSTALGQALAESEPQLGKKLQQVGDLPTVARTVLLDNSNLPGIVAPPVAGVLASTSKEPAASFSGNLTNAAKAESRASTVSGMRKDYASSDNSSAESGSKIVAASTHPLDGAPQQNESTTLSGSMASAAVRITPQWESSNPSHAQRGIDSEIHSSDLAPEVHQYSAGATGNRVASAIFDGANGQIEVSATRTADGVEATLRLATRQGANGAAATQASGQGVDRNDGQEARGELGVVGATADGLKQYLDAHQTPVAAIHLERAAQPEMNFGSGGAPAEFGGGHGERGSYEERGGQSREGMQSVDSLIAPSTAQESVPSMAEPAYAGGMLSVMA